MSNAETSVREFNMAKRRRRILAEARRLITRGGIEALNLRTLASAAEVTVPTIYNLVGKKEALVIALFTEALEEIEQRVRSAAHGSALEMTEAVVAESTGLFAEDENYFRSAFIALEHLDQTHAHHAAAERVYSWGCRMMTSGLNACRDAGLINGRIPAALLGDQILRAYRSSCRAWAFGQLSIEEFRGSALSDVYTCLAADAVETFHAQLVNKIAALKTTAASPTQRRARGEGAIR